MELLEKLARDHAVQLKLLGSKTAPSGQETFLAYTFA
jgi:hypothetical protein